MLDVLLIIGALIVLLGIVMLLWPLRVRVQIWPGRACLEVRYIIMRLTLDFLSRESTIRFAGFRVASAAMDRRKRLPSVKPAEEAKKRPPLRERIKTAKESGESRGTVLWENIPLLRQVLLRMVRLIGRLIGAWSLDHAKLGLVLGLGNPAHTGFATGCIYGALPSLQMSLPRWQIGFTPEFTRAYASIDADIALRLIPIEPLYQIVRTLGTLPWRRLWKLKVAFGQS